MDRVEGVAAVSACIAASDDAPSNSGGITLIGVSAIAFPSVESVPPAARFIVKVDPPDVIAPTTAKHLDRRRPNRSHLTQPLLGKWVM
jgi:hypothetical protein